MIFSNDKYLYKVTNITEQYEFGTQLAWMPAGQLRTAIHKQSNLKVMVNIISKEKIIKINNREEQLLKIIEMLAKETHNNILPTYECIHDKEYYYLVHSYTKHSSLGCYLRKSKKTQLNEYQARIIATQLFSAIDYLHDQSIVHQNINAQNIIVNSKNGKINITLSGIENANVMPNIKVKNGRYEKCNDHSLEKIYSQVQKFHHDLFMACLLIFRLLRGEHDANYDDIYDDLSNKKKQLAPDAVKKLNLSLGPTTFLENGLFMKKETPYFCKDFTRHPWIRDVK